MSDFIWAVICLLFLGTGVHIGLCSSDQEVSSDV